MIKAKLNIKERIAFAMCGAIMGKKTLFIVADMKRAREIRAIIKAHKMPRAVARMIRVQTMQAADQNRGVMFKAGQINTQLDGHGPILFIDDALVEP